MLTIYLQVDGTLNGLGVVVSLDLQCCPGYLDDVYTLVFLVIALLDVDLVMEPLSPSDDW